jgi:hypothetical protein
VRLYDSWDPAPVPSPDDFAAVPMPFGRIVVTFEPIGQPIGFPPVQPWRLEVPRGQAMLATNIDWRNADMQAVIQSPERVVSIHILPSRTNGGPAYRLVIEEAKP